ncbi:MAG: glycosyl hydrolase-related protein, partial [Sedimentisphaerales bacterium]
DFTKAQWKIKQAFALEADVQSRNLLNSALAGHRSKSKKVSAIDVFNTSSWPRTDLVIIPRHWKLADNIVFSVEGGAVPTTRLSTGEIAFIARDVPAFSAKRFILKTPALLSMAIPGSAKAIPPTVLNSYLTVTIDQKTGAIASLKHRDLPVDLCAGEKGIGLNDYFYVAGRDPKNPQRNGQVKVSVKERGPVVASLLIESDAPGCHKLSREVRLVAGMDRVDIINIIDKQKIYKQEAVHLAFPFNVPKGIMRMDTPWAVVQPEVDQLLGACKNYFTVQRWVDVSNKDYGVTWATVDAPLVEVGAITNDPRGGVGWIKKLEPSTTLYSYVMNNYWETNYKAGQEGPTTFRYSIMPHRRFDSGKASKFAIEQSQPLVAVPVDGKVPVQRSILSVEPTSVIVTAFKPSEDGRAWIVRLFNTDNRPVRAKIMWGKHAPKNVWLSNFAEEQVSRVTEPINMAGYEIVTLRVKLPERMRKEL